MKADLVISLPHFVCFQIGLRPATPASTMWRNNTGSSNPPPIDMFSDDASAEESKRVEDFVDDVNPAFRESYSNTLDVMYRDRHNIMKRAYEQRIVQLSDVIQETCQTLIGDEVLNSMKSDPVASAYTLPAIHEMLTNHINGEREKYVHQLIQNIGTLEGRNRSMADKNMHLTKKVNQLEYDNAKGKKAEQGLDALFVKFGDMEKEYGEHKMQSADQIKQLKEEIETFEKSTSELTFTVQSLNDSNMEKDKEINELTEIKIQNKQEILNLQSALEQSARDMQMIEDVEKEEQEIKTQLQKRLSELVSENSTLNAELTDLKNKLHFNELELAKGQETIKESQQELHENKTKTVSLMKQVEGMLAAEAQESNNAIAIVHEKMKNLRHQLSLEVAKEKRYSASLHEELLTLRSFKEEKSREIKNLIEDEADLRTKYNREVQRTNDLTLQIQELEHTLHESRKEMQDAEGRSKQAADMMKILEERLLENEKKFAEELRMAEDHARLEARKEMVNGVEALDLTSAAFRLRYQNEASAIQGAMRHSYSGLPTRANMQNTMDMSTIMNTAANTNTNHSDASEKLLKEAKEIWEKQKRELEANAHTHLLKIETLEHELDTARKKHMRDEEQIEEQVRNKTAHFEIEKANMQKKYEHHHGTLKGRLSEADINIEKLKGILTDKKQVIDRLQQQVQDTQQQVRDAHHRHKELTDHAHQHKHRHHHYANEYRKVYQQYEELSKHHDRHKHLSSSYETMERNYEQLQSQYEDIGNLFKNLEKRHQNEKHEKHSVQEDLRKAHLQLQHMKDQLSSLQDEVDTNGKDGHHRHHHSSHKGGDSNAVSLLMDSSSNKKKHHHHHSSHKSHKHHEREEETFKESANVDQLAILEDASTDSGGEATSPVDGDKKKHHYHRHHHGHHHSSSNHKDVEPETVTSKERVITENTVSEEQYESIKSDLNESNRNLRDSNRRVEDLERELSQLNEELINVKQREQENSKQAAEDQMLLSDMKNKFDALMSSYEESQAQVQIEKQKEEVLKTELDAELQAEETLEKEIEKEVGIIKGKEEQINHMTDVLNEEQTALVDMEKQLEEYENKILELSNALSIAKQERDQAQEEADAAIKKHELASQEISALEDLHNDVQQENNQLLLVKAQTQSELQSLSQELVLVKKELAKSEEGQKILQITNAQSSDAFVAVSNGDEDGDAANEERQRQKREKLEKIHQERLQQESTSTTIVPIGGNEHTQEMDAAKEKIEELTALNNELKAELEQTRSELQKKEAYIAKKKASHAHHHEKHKDDASSASSRWTVTTPTPNILVTDVNSDGEDDPASKTPVSVSRGPGGLMTLTTSDIKADPSSPANQVAKIAAFEAVTEGLLDALITSSVLTRKIANQIINLAIVVEGHSPNVSNVTQQTAKILSSALDQFNEYNKEVAKSVAEADTLSEELKSAKHQIKKLQSQLNKLTEEKRGGSQIYQTTERYDETIDIDDESSRGGDGDQSSHMMMELEQSKHEYNLVVELTKLEGDARTKTLLAEMKDLKKVHRNDLEKVKNTYNQKLELTISRYEAQCATYIDEIEGLKQTVGLQAEQLNEQSNQRSSTLDSKLQIERNKRRELIKEFERIDQEHRVTIEELESLNLQLEQRCEKAELQVTKLRMEAINGNGATSTTREPSSPSRSARKSTPSKKSPTMPSTPDDYRFDGHYKGSPQKSSRRSPINVEVKER